MASSRAQLVSLILSTTMNDRDVQVGRNIAAYRAGRSQQWLADAMRSFGWKWSQATVWAVEKGERPLRLSEALDVAMLLGMHSDQLHALLYSSPEVELSQAADATRQAAMDMTDAMGRFMDKHAALGLAIEDAKVRPDATSLAESSAYRRALAEVEWDLMRYARSAAHGPDEINDPERAAAPGVEIEEDVDGRWCVRFRGPDPQGPELLVNEHFPTRDAALAGAVDALSALRKSLPAGDPVPASDESREPHNRRPYEKWVEEARRMVEESRSEQR